MHLQPKHPFGFRLAAMDLDDTLLGPDKQISSENAAAVCELRERGVRVVLASGRRQETMIQFHRALSLDGPIISSQGALVRDAETGCTLHRKCIPARIASELVAQATAVGVTLVYYHMDAIYIAERNRFTDLYESRGGDAVEVCGDLNRLSGKTPLKVIWLDEPACIAAHLIEASLHYRDALELVVSNPEYLEFTAFGINKATGLEVVARHYGIDRSEVLAFGDGNNDAAMLRWAGTGVAMSVATPDAKAAATFTAPPGPANTSLARAVGEILKDSLYE